MTRFIYISLLALSSAFSTSVYAVNRDLADAPLYLGGSNSPNIMFTLDDSGSMHWEYMPDNLITDLWFKEPIYMFPRANHIYGAGDYKNIVPDFAPTNLRGVRLRSNDVSSTFYSPKIKYLPWMDSIGLPMGDASPTCARHNPMNLATCATPFTNTGRNLTVNNTQKARWYTGLVAGSPGTKAHVTRTFYPATYFNYIGPPALLTNIASFNRVEIKPANAPFVTILADSADRNDCTILSATSVSCSYNEEMQNFANWYTYYRSRILIARAGVGRAFSEQGTNMRVGFGSINTTTHTVDGVATRTVIAGVRDFSGVDRSAWFNNLYNHVMVPNSTPLRRATNGVGKYYQRSDNPGPWGIKPGVNDPTEHLSCRQSYHILMSDGYWNGSGPSPAAGNSDSTPGTTITGPLPAPNDTFTYIPGPPYSDSNSNSLADVAMKYWKTDLRPGLTNNVRPNSADPAFWQHMVNFTVGLGVGGTLDPANDLPALTTGALQWPSVASFDGKRIDDLWHAAVNSRGEFFSASNPQVFANKLSDILANIVGRDSAAGTVALNSGTITGGSALYQSGFNSASWTGKVERIGLSVASGVLVFTPDAVWNAQAADLTGPRDIFTHNGVVGKPFLWADISVGQQALLNNDPTLLDYLRGDQSGEPIFRERATTLLGDIVHSSPQYIGKPTMRYPEIWDGGPETPYSVFKAAKAGRTPHVYVGANDGMLHAFNANPATGQETFAYVPAGVYNNLAELANPDYNHKYYVDGTPVVTDAFIGGNWRTVLVSGLRGGGQSIFALDVTNPDAFGVGDVLWEFTDDDLGYTFGTPSIVRMHNGGWVAIFSGGYDNARDNDGDGAAGDSIDGNGYLYFVDLATGALLQKFDSTKGFAEDPTGQNKSNGLSTPSAVDLDGDFIVDVVYAGDLFGNVWKIDVMDTDPSNWETVFGTKNSPVPLYTACAAVPCTPTDVQSITTQLQVVRHPEKGGYLVLFGTGKYIEIGDNSNVSQTTQTFYGIWDKAEPILTAFDRSDLLQQEILVEAVVGNFNARGTSNHQIDWATHLGWRMDLFNTEGGNTDNFGERQVSNSVVRNGHIIFSTLLPTDDPCDDGGTSWIMELDMLSGSRLEFSPFDLDEDGEFTTTDFILVDGVWVPVSGVDLGIGITDTPAIIRGEDGSIEFKLGSGSAAGALSSIGENPGPAGDGRQSWRELEF